MPQLPSGRHVAIDPTPFLELAKDIDNPFNAHKIMAMPDRKSWSCLNTSPKPRRP